MLLRMLEMVFNQYSTSIWAAFNAGDQGRRRLNGHVVTRNACVSTMSATKGRALTLF